MRRQSHYRLCRKSIWVTQSYEIELAAHSRQWLWRSAPSFLPTAVAEHTALVGDAGTEQINGNLYDLQHKQLPLSGVAG